MKQITPETRKKLLPYVDKLIERFTAYAVGGRRRSCPLCIEAEAGCHECPVFNYPDEYCLDYMPTYHEPSESKRIVRWLKTLRTKGA